MRLAQHWNRDGLIVFSGALLALFFFCPNAAHAAFVQEQELTISGGAAFDLFGYSVSMTPDHSRMAIGAYHENSLRGAVYIYTFDGVSWSEEQRIVASDSAASDRFGYSVALSADGTRVVVGQPKLNFNQGAAYVFLRTGTTWTHEKKLISADPLTSNYYGESVAMSADGTRAAVGAPGDFDSDTGYAYIYSRSGATWTQEQKITGETRFYANSIAMDLDGAHLAIGSPKCTFFWLGCVHIYSRALTTWTQEAELTPDGGGASFNEFGDGVSMTEDGSRIIVSSYGESGSTGAAYIFASTSLDPSWHRESTLTAPGTTFQFGRSVAISADSTQAVVGAAGENSSRGAAYEFSRTGTSWSQSWKSLADDGATGDSFGLPVAMNSDGTRFIVGASARNGSAGAAYSFKYALPQTLSIVFAGAGTGTVDSAPSGIDGCTSDCDTIFGQGQGVTLTATPDDDSIFTGWTGDPDCSDGIVTMSTDLSCTATFTLKPVLSIIFAGTGTGTVADDLFFLSCTSACSAYYDPSTVVTLTATPDTDMQFDGWSGDADCSDGQVTMAVDTSCTATFSPIPSGSRSGSLISPDQLARLFGTPLSGKTDINGAALHEGQLISAYPSGDPDVYIVNAWGFRRLFLNPIIFNFYAHLGGYSAVRTITGTTRDSFPTSGLFRNCETNDEAVYALEVTGEDTGTLHHVKLTGDQAVQQDPDFFKKVFCINSNEQHWYSVSASDYTSLSQLPVYHR